MTSTDIAILGGGPAGYATALRANQLGLTVTLVEQDLVGGTCLHRGCVPTKALLHAAEIADGARQAHQFGVTAAFSGIDVNQLHTFKNTIVRRLHQGLDGLLTGRGITVISGRGELAGPHTIQVGDNAVHAESIVLATGSLPRILPGVELGEKVITSDQALHLSFILNRSSSSAAVSSESNSPASGHLSAPRSPLSKPSRACWRARTRSSPPTSKGPSDAAG